MQKVWHFATLVPPSENEDGSAKTGPGASLQRMRTLCPKRLSRFGRVAPAVEIFEVGEARTVGYDCTVDGRGLQREGASQAICGSGVDVEQRSDGAKALFYRSRHQTRGQTKRQNSVNRNPVQIKPVRALVGVQASLSMLIFSRKSLPRLQLSS